MTISAKTFSRRSDSSALACLDYLGRGVGKIFQKYLFAGINRLLTE